MDFLMESGFMQWMSERMSFTNWVKADFHETFHITLKFSAPPRLRVRYRLDSARGVRAVGTACSKMKFFLHRGHRLSFIGHDMPARGQYSSQWSRLMDH